MCQRQSKRSHPRGQMFVHEPVQKKLCPCQLPSTGAKSPSYQPSASNLQVQAAVPQKPMAKANPAGLLGGWLLRGLKAGASTPPDGTIIPPEAETPTWSEASEASGSDTQPDPEDPASSQARSKASGPPADKGPGLTSRFGGWLSGERPHLTEAPPACC